MQNLARFNTLAGSTHVITPEGFIDDLKVLDLGGAGSKALYNGVRARGMASSSFQAFYDQKYSIPDPAPPPRTASAPIADNSRLVPNKLVSARSFQSTTSDLGDMSNGSEANPRVLEKKKEKKSRFFRF
jgi:syntaxin-binding protein 1